MTPEKKRAYLYLHIAVFLFGFTAILGKLITLREVGLVWHRLWITCLSLIFFPGVMAGLKAMSKKEFIRFMAIGIVTCSHWLTFYGSIKLSNVSIALSCLATSSLFTSLLEPLLFKKRINPIELVLGVIVAIGIAIITRASMGYQTGIIVGLISAFLAAAFSTLNKKYMEGHHPVSMTFLELGTGFLMITLLLPLYKVYFPEINLMPAAGNQSDWIYLIILAILCTSVAYVLALMALKELTAFTANLAINLEPIYGILMAMAIFHEHRELDYRFYIGTALILGSVLLHPILNKWLKPKLIQDQQELKSVT